MTELPEFDFGDDVDFPTFEQILEMDEGEDEGGHEFSYSIVFGFFDQATQTFQKMRDALRDKDLPTLSSLGHYLKGSSATLGFTKVKVECEKIQHYGDHKDETGLKDEDDDTKLLDLIDNSLSKAQKETATCEELMRKYYDKLGVAA